MNVQLTNLIFDNVEVNQGSAYNPATGEFTVPYAGTYLIYASAGKVFTLKVKQKTPRQDNGVFTLTETKTETENDGTGFYGNVRNSTHYTETDTVADAIAFCTRFHRSLSLSRFDQCKHTITKNYFKSKECCFQDLGQADS